MMGFISNMFARSDPVISEAAVPDAAAIAALHAAAFHRGWSEQEVEGLLLDRNVMTHRAMADGKLAGRALAGFIMSRLAADEAEILSVAVGLAWRGRGLARSLLTLHLRRLAGLGIRAVLLEVGESNAPAIQLYTRAGFHEVSRRENYYRDAAGQASTALVLRRDLT